MIDAFLRLIARTDTGNASESKKLTFKGNLGI